MNDTSKQDSCDPRLNNEVDNECDCYLTKELGLMFRSLPTINPSDNFANRIEARIRSTTQDTRAHRRNISEALRAWAENYTHPWIYGLGFNVALLLLMTFNITNYHTNLLPQSDVKALEQERYATASELDLSDTLLSYSEDDSIETFWEDYLPKEDV